MSDDIKEYLEHCVRIQRSNAKQTDVMDRSPDAFVLRHGRSFEYGRTEIYGAEKQCFCNAALLALDNPDLTYCEGYVECFIPIEHAWCIDKQGRVIETTLRSQERVGKYFGVPIKTDFLRRQMLADERYGVFGWMSYEWRNATPEEIVSDVGLSQPV
jgi:hypothetical protein